MGGEGVIITESGISFKLIEYPFATCIFEFACNRGKQQQTTNSSSLSHPQSNIPLSSLLPTTLCNHIQALRTPFTPSNLQNLPNSIALAQKNTQSHCIHARIRSIRYFTNRHLESVQ